MQINWDSFKLYNQDADGIRLKFEDLCRQLFANEKISGNKQFRYLHANPNNAGLETEPIYDEVNQRWIGFQAKYFDDKVNYRDIEDSAQKTVVHYSGRVEIVFLFCNKPLTSSSLAKTVSILQQANISLQLVTDDAILDLVRSSYPYLGSYYFGNHTLDAAWFKGHTAHMFDELSERYNRSFNVETEYSIELSLFLHDQTAAKYMNEKKGELLKEIERLYGNHEKNRSYLCDLRTAVESLPDVDSETLYDSILWFSIVTSAVRPHLDQYEQKSKSLENDRDKAYGCSYDLTQPKDVCNKARNDYHEIVRKINDIEMLLELPYMLQISEREQQLLQSNVMSLQGRAGTGKSQLLAYKTNNLLKENRIALLLLAGIYLSEAPIQEQIMCNLRLDYSFEELIDVLENIGEINNRIVPIFIDALNETWNKRLWKIGLPLIIDKVKKAPMVKLVFSFRPEYGQLLFTDFIREEITKGAIATMIHRGFEGNSGSAVREFLNHYNIPFTPLEFFGAEMTNPLFLTLYCKTYNGEEVSLPTLYERLIVKANGNIIDALNLHSYGFSEADVILRSLVSQIAAQMAQNDRRMIAKADMMKLSFWSEYGLVPARYVNQLVKEELLHDYVFDGDEYYYFAYDQMNDYYCAKTILDAHINKEDVRVYLKTEVLKIEDGKLNNYGGIDLFINACALYAEKYGEECIDIIDTLDENDRWEVFSRYIKSFQWREIQSISKALIYDLLKKYPCRPDDIWPMLIGNSVKVQHPLNADFLHEFLKGYALNKRDHLWTIYINNLTLDNENRVVQLIEMYDRGDKLDNSNEKQLELLLTLFGWLLTSSNRWLRDYTSKAMIEILKEHFQLCAVILKKFKDVNDPYVIQRLYGVIFGACCKRECGDLQSLAEYTYETVFNQEKVYPDILLRDYARMIIERFLYENPDYSGVIAREKIAPPYNSDAIPALEDQHYLEKDYDGVMFWLMHSMCFDGMGLYGDFGRYVFQSALRSFDVDDKKIFNYAIYYILNDLGFNEEYFGDHDRHCGSYERHTTVKTERIGKKYQWITMYNILARISDHCKMIDRWNYPAKEEVWFEGAWDPYVRDFDPTLNRLFMTCGDAPIFKQLEEHKEKGIAENRATNIFDPQVLKGWLETKGVFYRELKDTLILTDDDGQQWVCLTKYCDTGRKDLDIKKLSVWCWLYAYFMTPEQADEFVKCAEKGLPIISSDIASHHETYSVFNREYPWSPSCHEFEEYAWVNTLIKTGEMETITETVQVPDLSSIEALLRKYGGFLDEDRKIDDEVGADDDGIVDEDNFEVPEIQYKVLSREREIEKEIGIILHATTDLLWEEEYDATKETAISHSVPCGKLIEVMGLSQLVADGFLYDKAGKLAAFDTNLTQKINSVVVRKDILDEFLTRTGMKLVWLVDAEKEIHAGDYSIASWSDWEAVFVYESESISGEIQRLPNGNRW